MVSFWALFLLFAYGILGGFVHFANGAMKDWFGMKTEPWATQVPLLGDFGPGMAAALVLLAIVGFIIYRLLAKPKVVTYLAETESEMRKVVWPTWKETRTGTFAVIVTVGVMLAFLWVVDTAFLELFKRLFSLNFGG